MKAEWCPQPKMHRPPNLWIHTFRCDREIGETFAGIMNFVIRGIQGGQVRRRVRIAGRYRDWDGAESGLEDNQSSQPESQGSLLTGHNHAPG